MAIRKSGTGWREHDVNVDLIDDDEVTLIDDAPEDGFELIDEDNEKPDDRRRDPLRRPI